MKLHTRSEDGQVIPLIALVVLVFATIGFSIAGTAIKNIQETAMTEESERAYSAAEAGLEEKLLEIEQTGDATGITNQEIAGGAVIKEVAVSKVDELQITSLPQDEVAQVNLACSPSQCSPGDIDVSWDAGTSIVMTRISGTSDPYNVERWAYNCNNNTQGNGFTNIATASGTCSVTVDIDGSPSGRADQVLRIRVMYDSSSLSVVPSGIGTIIPVQSVVLTSTGQSGETERTVQVERSAPVAPSILDYVLFSSQGSLSK